MWKGSVFRVIDFAPLFKAVVCAPCYVWRSLYISQVGTCQDRITYGWDMELELPFREKNSIREPGLPLDETAILSMPADGFVVGHWPDGSSAQLQVQAKDLMSQLKSKRKSGSHGENDLAILYHKATKNKITIRQRVDHNLLVVGMEQTRCVYSLRVSLFGTVENEREHLDSSHPALIAATAFAKLVLQAYCDDEFQRDQILTHKKKMMLDKGIATTKADAKGDKVKKVEVDNVPMIEAEKEEATKANVEKVVAKKAEAKNAAAKKRPSSAVPKGGACKHYKPEIARPFSFFFIYLSLALFRVSCIVLFCYLLFSTAFVGFYPKANCFVAVASVICSSCF